MLITINQIRMIRMKMKEYVDNSITGKLDKDQLMELADWILRSYDRRGINADEEERKAIKESILAAYFENSKGMFSVSEFAGYFRLVKKVTSQ